MLEPYGNFDHDIGEPLTTIFPILFLSYVACWNYPKFWIQINWSNTLPVFLGRHANITIRSAAELSVFFSISQPNVKAIFRTYFSYLDLMCTDVGRVCHVKKKEMRVKKEEEEKKKPDRSVAWHLLWCKRKPVKTLEGHFKNNTR